MSSSYFIPTGKMLVIPTGNKVTQFWTPARLDLIVWYDADDTSTITEVAGAVSDLADKSGNGKTLSQSSAGAKPDTGTRTINSLNVLDFDGSDYMVSSAISMPSSGDFAVFFVGEIDAINNAVDSLFAIYNGLSNDFQFDAANASQFNGRINVTGLGGDPALSGGPYSSPSVYSLIFDYAGANTYNAFVDGTQKTTDTTYSNKIATGPVVHLFANNLQTAFPDGAFGEMIVLEDVTTATQQKIEGYLAWKWSGAL